MWTLGCPRLNWRVRSSFFCHFTNLVKLLLHPLKSRSGCVKHMWNALLDTSAAYFCWHHALEFSHWYYELCSMYVPLRLIDSCPSLLDIWTEWRVFELIDLKIPSRYCWIEAMISLKSVTKCFIVFLDDLSSVCPYSCLRLFDFQFSV